MNLPVRGCNRVEGRFATASEARPWFRKQIGWWCAYVGGRQVRLARGEGKNGETKANAKLKELLALRNANPVPESNANTVAAASRHRMAAPTSAAGVYVDNSSIRS